MENRHLIHIEEGRIEEERAERARQHQLCQFVREILTSVDESLRTMSVSLNEQVVLMRSSHGAHTCLPPRRGPRRPPRTRGGWQRYNL